jgi:hypothetical protein
MKPKYLARQHDGAILKRNENGTYSFIESNMHRPYEYSLDSLLSLNFEPVTEEDFPALKEKGDLYYQYMSWYHRSDGHGGVKGGSLEDFMNYKIKFGHTK